MHDDFFEEVDRRWTHDAPTRIHLHVIGSAALMMRVDYQRATKDGDVIETFDAKVADNLRVLAGKGSEIHTRRRIYLDIVASGIPFLPQVPNWHSLPELNARLTRFEIAVLDVVDVVVSKLKRFHANDRSDIEAMVDRGLVPHDSMIERFRAAVDVFAYDARAEDLPAIVRNLNQVERDLFGLPASEIALPSWV
jgi:hypothetical protein